MKKSCAVVLQQGPLGPCLSASSMFLGKGLKTLVAVIVPTTLLLSCSIDMRDVASNPGLSTNELFHEKYGDMRRVMPRDNLKYNPDQNQEDVKYSTQYFMGEVRNKIEKEEKYKKNVMKLVKNSMDYFNEDNMELKEALRQQGVQEALENGKIDVNRWLKNTTTASQDKVMPVNNMLTLTELIVNDKLDENTVHYSPEDIEFLMQNQPDTSFYAKTTNASPDQMKLYAGGGQKNFVNGEAMNSYQYKPGNDEYYHQYTKENIFHKGYAKNNLGNAQKNFTFVGYDSLQNSVDVMRQNQERAQAVNRKRLLDEYIEKYKDDFVTDGSGGEVDYYSYLQQLKKKEQKSIVKAKKKLR